ncbi:MAG: hypothetical protein JWP00_1794 [Chloroflexi bacterium]|jgi:hypothetical protein|nr:hypothetical protein [Chloroflexota bacterium]
MISQSTIDQLTVAIALDGQLRGEFMINRLEAIEAYNRGYARRFGESPILLNDEERRLVTSVPAGTIQQFYEAMAAVLEQIEETAFYQPQFIPGKMLTTQSFIEPDRNDLIPIADQVSAA